MDRIFCPMFGVSLSRSRGVCSGNCLDIGGLGETILTGGGEGCRDGEICLIDKVFTALRVKGGLLIVALPRIVADAACGLDLEDGIYITTLLNCLKKVTICGYDLYLLELVA